jgi:hypothetical protein
MKVLNFVFDEETRNEVVEISAAVLQTLFEDNSEDKPCLCPICISKIVMQVFVEYVDQNSEEMNLPNQENINLN